LDRIEWKEQNVRGEKMNTSELPIGIIYVIIGIIILTSGRKLFWLFVGCIGFAVGFHYTPYLYDDQSHLLLMIIAIFMGIIGAVLAVFSQKIAIGLAGFAAGGYIAVNLFSLFGLRIGHILWLPYLIGGIIGALFLFLIFDWSLIIVSCFAGASIIIQAVSLDRIVKLGVYFVLIILGIIIQTVLFLRSKINGEEKLKRR
jgi:hypothetical protein